MGDFSLGKTLGTGAFGRVRFVTHKAADGELMGGFCSRTESFFLKETWRFLGCSKDLFEVFSGVFSNLSKCFLESRIFQAPSGVLLSRDF